MKFVIFDKSEVGNVEVTPEGFLIAKGKVTRTGVLNYKKPDGSLFRQLRLPEEVFKDSSMKTLEFKPVTLEHPFEMVDSSNARTVARGMVAGKPIQEGDFLTAPLVITDKQAIESLQNGDTKELSCGYWCDLEEKPGVYKGESYDAIQRNITYNHVALTKKGRAGPDVRVQLDSEETKVFIQDVEETATPNNTGGNMETVKVMLNGKEFDLPKDVAEALNAHCAAMEDACKSKMDEQTKAMGEKEAALASQKAESDKVQAMADSLKAEKEALEKKIAEHKDSVSQEQVNELVKQRVRVLSIASKCLDSKTLEGKSDKDIKIEVIKHENKDAVLDGKSDEYINAYFDVLADKIEKNTDAFAKVGSGLLNNTNKDSGNEDSAETARKKMVEESNNAWKQSIGYKLEK